MTGSTGSPQYSAQFSNWNTKPVVSVGIFKFNLPKDAVNVKGFPINETSKFVIKKEDE